jgi:hypothetical protein
VRARSLFCSDHGFGRRGGSGRRSRLRGAGALERRSRVRGRVAAALNPSHATLQSLFGTDEAGRLSFGAFAGAPRGTLPTQQARRAVAREAPPFEAPQASAR